MVGTIQCWHHKRRLDWKLSKPSARSNPIQVEPTVLAHALLLPGLRFIPAWMRQRQHPVMWHAHPRKLCPGLSLLWYPRGHHHGMAHSKPNNRPVPPSRQSSPSSSVFIDT